jgi:XTP/dITP diphosphohydrolase
MLSLIIATGNAHKVEEFDRMFAAAGLKVTAHSAKLVGGMPKVVEDSGTFAGNAMLKARALRAVAGPEHWVMADDSGLECEALGGMPGVDTAVYAGPHATNEQNRAKLVAAMSGVTEGKRGARFVCHLTLLGPAGEFFEFTGECPGSIATSESGNGGFGYDPLFIPTGHALTFAELDPSIKDALSHRAKAFAKLSERLRRLG